MNDTFLGPEVLVVYTWSDKRVTSEWVHAFFLREALFEDPRLGEEIVSSRVIDFGEDISPWSRSI